MKKSVFAIATIAAFSAAATAANAQALHISTPLNAAAISFSGNEPTPGAIYSIYITAGAITGTPTVLVNGVAQQITAWDSTQINFVLGNNWPVFTTFSLQVTTTTGQSSQLTQVQSGDKDPGLYTCNFTQPLNPWVQIYPSYKIVGPCSPNNAPVPVGSYITLYGNAFADTRVMTSVSASATVGSHPVDVYYAGLVGGSTSEWQLNINIPAGTPTGQQLMLVTVNGNTLAPFSMTIQ